MNMNYFRKANEVLEKLYEECDRVADFEIAVYLFMRYGYAFAFDDEEQFGLLREYFNSRETIFDGELNDRVENILADRESEEDDYHTINYEEIEDWLREHEQAWEDYENAYYMHDYDSIVEWISEHKTLAEDFEMYFGIDIDDL